MFLEQRDLLSEYLQLGRAPDCLPTLLRQPAYQIEMYIDPSNPTDLGFPHCATIRCCMLLGFL